MIYRPGPRRVLDGGTLAADFLGETIVSQVARLDEQTRDLVESSLPLSVAGAAYVRSFGQLLLDGWGRENVAASLTNSALGRFGNSWQGGVRPPVSGSVIALAIWLSAARSAGSCTVTVWVEGAATELAAVIDGDAPLAVVETLAAGMAVFGEGEEITLRVTTTGAWAPASADLQAWIIVGLEGV